TRDLRSAETFNAFYFTPALSSNNKNGGSGLSISSLFSTHPSLQTRLDQLAKIEAELGRPA
ncbi:MAG TPA: hypothetical protein VNV87_16275, partial [Acidimicrobiales bacterium]|nr:hypothetical protein [Acidimicrobiales bacterium]